MILFVSILFALFFLVIISYNKLSSLSVRFLCGTFICWCAAIVCLLLFLSNQSYYWGAVNRIFYITPFMWNILLKNISAGSDWFIRGMNIGAAGFYYCALCFSIAFTNRNTRQSKYLYRGLLAVSSAQVILFDPGVQKLLQASVGDERVIRFEQYNQIFFWIQKISSFINLGYCLVVMVLLIHYYLSYPRIRFLKRYTLFNIACILPVVCMFAYTFNWFPAILVKATMKKGYYNYLIPDLSVKLLNSGWFYVTLMLVYAAMLIYLFKYKSIEDYYKKDTQNVKISLDTASLGINTFTHAIKNHIQGIKSEVEYLTTLHPEDKELQDSTRCILESCEFCFTSVENANKQLKKLKLKLTLMPISRIIHGALGILDGDTSNIEVRNLSDEYIAYLDEEAMTEVVLNLIHNAREAIDGREGGWIRIEVSARGKWNVITVEDNGTGIAEDDMGKVFNPFFSTKSTVHNWGMGLAYCYQVVTAHDGRITVDSTLGKGSVFSVALPVI